jgi:hypothetical protein
MRDVICEVHGTRLLYVIPSCKTYPCQKKETRSTVKVDTHVITRLYVSTHTVAHTLRICCEHGRFGETADCPHAPYQGAGFETRRGRLATNIDFFSQLSVVSPTRFSLNIGNAVFLPYSFQSVIHLNMQLPA